MDILQHARHATSEPHELQPQLFDVLTQILIHTGEPQHQNFIGGFSERNCYSLTFFHLCENLYIFDEERITAFNILASSCSGKHQTSRAYNIL